MKRLAIFLCLLLTFSVAADARLMVNQLSGFGVKQGTGAAVSVTFLSAATSTTDTNSYSPSMDIGTAGADRHIVALIQGRIDSGPGTSTSVTVNGTGLTKHAESVGSSETVAAIYSGLVTSGSGSQTVTVVFSGTSRVMFIRLYDIRGFSTTVHDTAAQAADPSTLTIDAAADGVIFGVGASQNPSTTNHSWTNLTEQSEATLESNEYRFSTAYTDGLSSETNRAVSVDFIGTSSQRAGVAVSFTP